MKTIAVIGTFAQWNDWRNDMKDVLDINKIKTLNSSMIETETFKAFRVYSMDSVRGMTIDEIVLLPYWWLFDPQIIDYCKIHMR